MQKKKRHACKSNNKPYENNSNTCTEQIAEDKREKEGTRLDFGCLLPKLALGAPSEIASFLNIVKQSHIFQNYCIQMEEEHIQLLQSLHFIMKVLT